jgi:hypothetical protein
MLLNESLTNEGMRCSRIKKNYCRVIRDSERTHQYRLSLRGCGHLRAVNLSCPLFTFARLIVCWSILALTLTCISCYPLEVLPILLGVGAILDEVTRLPIIETSICLIWWGGKVNARGTRLSNLGGSSSWTDENRLPKWI